MLSDILVVLKFVMKLYRQIIKAKADADMREAIDEARKLKDTSKLERIVADRLRDS
jgi:hypothetical protein